jgi:effector-binding domain-containing protein
MLRYATAAAAVLVLTGAQARADYAEPAYTVVKQAGEIEIRDYAPMIVAEVTQTGERAEAISAGFKPLAAYIFGKNSPKVEIAMTAPVTQESQGQAIAMTAPVTQESGPGDVWKVRFVMPKQWTMATLPQPIDPDIRLIEIPSERRAVIRFSGFRWASLLAEKTADLSAYIAAEGHVPVGEPVYAFYDPPWTLPFLRRNEIMWRLKSSN